MQSNLQYPGQPIGVIPAFTRHQQPMTLKAKEQFGFSGDDFDITDPNTGQNIFQVHAKALSLSQKKTFTDARGGHIFTLTKSPFINSFDALDQNGKVLFNARKKMSFMSAKIDITFNNLAGDGRMTTLKLRGDFMTKDADIMLENGAPVARISRAFSGTDIFFDKQTYFVMVAPG